MSYLGIRGFESILRGGIPTRAEVLLLTPQGTERYLLGAHWVIEGLKRGERVLVVLAGEDPEVFFARLGRMGIDVPSNLASGSMVVVDWHACWSQAVDGVQDVDHMIRASRKPEDLLAAIDKAVSVLLPATNRRAFVDVLPVAAKMMDEGAVTDLLKGIRSRLSAQDVTSIFFADRAAPELTLAALTKDFHAVLDARGEGPELLAFAVLRVGGARLTRRYRRVRLREDGASVEAEPTARTFSCPICDARVPFEADRCPSCGTLRSEMGARREEGGLMNYLQSLGRTTDSSRRTVVSPAEGRAPASTTGPRAGKVNGTAPGRVNGTAPGRVNGIAPKGRTNGMVNGTRTRTTPTTNGLTNGLRRARGGITNGLTNGSGFTNGLGSRRARVEAHRARWKLYLAPLVAAGLLLTPLLISESATRPRFVVDGDFSEWSGVQGYSQDPSADVNATVALTGYKVNLSDGELHLFASVWGTWFADPDSVDALYAFIDADRNASTGYRVLGLGAEFQAAVEGSDGVLTNAALREWRGNADRDNWTSWAPRDSMVAAATAGNLELSVPWDAGMWRDPTILLLADDGKGGRSYSVPFGPAALGDLRVTATAAADTVSGSTADLLSLDLFAIGASVKLTKVEVALSAGASLVQPALPVTVGAGLHATLTLQVDVTSLGDGALVNATLAGVTTEGNRPALIVGGTVRAYVGPASSAPTDKRVDGWFRDWTPAEFQPDSEANVVPADRDIRQFAANRTATNLFLYVDVKGSILAGTPIPIHRAKPGTGQNPTQSAPTSPARVAGEDVLRVYVDVDRNQADGVAILGLRGADLLLEVRGIHGRILQSKAYEWRGDWRPIATPPAANDATRLEASLPVPATGAIEVVFQTSGWDGPADSTAVAGTRGVRSDAGGGYTYEGRFTATFTPSGQVEIAARHAQFAWTLPDPYPGDPTGMPWTLQPTPTGVRYSRADVEVRFTLDSSAVRQQFVLSGPDPPPNLAFPIDWGNDTLLYIEDGKPIGILGGQDQVFELEAPNAVDGAGRETPVEMTANLTAKILSVLLPPSLRSSPPVVIDSVTSYILRDDGPTYKANEGLGYSVAIGDFNGDGYADVLAGAPFWGYGSHTSVGYAYVYYGPFSSDKTAPDVRINGTTDGGSFGFAVAAGKFNNDAFWDALIARHSILTNVGPVCLFYGSSSWSGDVSACDVKFEPPADFNQFGVALAAGNVDNSFYDDVLIGSSGHDNDNNGVPGDGVAYLYKSPFAADITTANWTLYPSSNSSGQFGKSVSIGYIDSDAYSDLMAGEPAYSGNIGRVQFYKGSRFVSNSGSRIPDATINAPSGGGSSSQFGASVAVGGLDSDAYADVLVGAPVRNSNNGAAFIYLANSDGSGLTSGASASVTLAGTSGEKFGTSVAIMDWNGDGTADTFVGAIAANGNGGSPSAAGRMYWFDNPLSDQTADAIIYGTALNENLGQSLAVGKFASDSFVLLAVGAYRWPKTGTQTDGRVIIATIPESPVALLALALAVPPIVRRLRSRSGSRRRRAPARR